LPLLSPASLANMGSRSECIAFAPNYMNSLAFLSAKDEHPQALKDKV